MKGPNMALVESVNTSARESSDPGAIDVRERRAVGGDRTQRERRRQTRRRLRQGLTAILGVGAAAATVLALRPRPVPVDVATASRGVLEVAIEESGTVRVKDRYVVSAPVSGSLGRLPLEPGDPIQEGDTLAEIAPARSPLLDERARAESEGRLGAATAALAQVRAQAARAAAAKEQSEHDLDRVRRLAASNSVAPEALEQEEFAARMRTEELASATFAVKGALEDVRVARAALGSTQSRGSGHVDILAPVSGKVLAVHQKSAGVVQAGLPIVEVGDPSALEVIVDLLTTDAVHVKPGTLVSVRGWGEDRPLSARVRLIEPSAFTRPSALGVDEQRVNVIASLTEPHEHWAALGDGYRVEARFVLWHAPEVLKVPMGAVFRHGDTWAAFRVDGGVARLVPLVIGHRGENEVEVLSGLPTGTTVVVHPGDRVRDGARVEAR
jgi:HlyD family secretion protein